MYRTKTPPLATSIRDNLQSAAVARKFSRLPVLPDNTDGDYTWDGASFWLTYKGRSIWVRLAENGTDAVVTVETFRARHEGEDPHDSGSALLPPRRRRA